MSNRAKGESAFRMLSVSEAAAEAGVSAYLVMKWSKAGHFRTFVPPGVSLGGRPGHKTLRLLRDDWEAFIRANLISGQVGDEAAKTVKPVPAPLVATGTDGVSRRGKRR